MEDRQGLARVGEHADLYLVGADVEAGHRVADEVLHLPKARGRHRLGGVHDEDDVGWLQATTCERKKNIQTQINEQERTSGVRTSVMLFAFPAGVRVQVSLGG